MTGEYINSLEKTEFQCVNGHSWQTSLNNVLHHKSGCPHCAAENVGLTKQQRELTKDQLNLDIAHRGIQMIGEYTNAKTKSEFSCQCGHTWHATSDNISKGRGCPACAAYGFNPNKPGWEYAFTRDGYIKYGITNDLVRRLSEHRRHGEFVLIHERYHKVGQDARDWESLVKKYHGGKYATKEQCPDGYTETLCLSKLNAIVTVDDNLTNGDQRSKSEII